MPEYTQRIHEILDEAEHQKPSNEAQVCQCVIVPILAALGYGTWDILPQGIDSNGQYPDYTILPNTEHTWYLEVKAWDVRLEDRFVHQALNYANQNARRWVVLTNGQVWRLYDNHVQEQADGKMVVEASLGQRSELMALFEALSPASVRRGLDRFATVARLQRYLAGELGRADSEIIKVISKIVREQPGMSAATPGDVLNVLSSLQSTDPQQSRAAVEVTETESPSAAVGARIEDGPSNERRSEGDSLLDLSRPPDRATGSRSESVIFPDGAERTVKTWADVAQQVVQWIADRGVMPPTPYCSSRPAASKQRSFINDCPRHPDGAPMKGFREISAAGKTLYVDTNRSAANFIASLVRLCEAVGISSAEFRIKLRARDE